MILRRIKRAIFRRLSRSLVALTGHGYDRAASTNQLHHKLGYRLFKRAPAFGFATREKIDFKTPVPFSLLYDPRDGGVGHKFLMYGEYEPNMTRVVQALIAPAMHVWNVGANLGYYTVLASNLAINGNVTSFEPHPVNADLLRKNIRLNRLTNVTVVESAIAERTGELSFFESESNTGDHRIAAEGDRRAITVKSLAAHEAISQYGSPGLIVMDVQGAEGIILRSLKDSLRSTRPMIVMEFWPEGLAQSGSSADEVEELLHALEYQVWRIDEYRSTLLRVEPGRIARGMAKGEETNVLCLPKGMPLPSAISTGWR